MTWTTAVTQVTGTLITAAIYNGQIIGNLNHLYARPNDETSYKVPSGIAVTSTSFVDADATNLILNVTTGSTQIAFIVSLESDGSTTTYFDVVLDSTTRAGDATYGLVAARLSVPVSFAGLFTGVSVGAHTLKVQHRVASGTGGIRDSVVSMSAWEF